MAYFLINRSFHGNGRLQDESNIDMDLTKEIIRISTRIDGSILA